MVKPEILANAAGTVMALFFVVCVLISYIAPDLLFTLAQSWMHTVNLQSIRSTFVLNFGNLLFGLVSSTVLTWITVYVTVYLYNRWSK